MASPLQSVPMGHTKPVLMGAGEPEDSCEVMGGCRVLQLCARCVVLGLVVQGTMCDRCLQASSGLSVPTPISALCATEGLVFAEVPAFCLLVGFGQWEAHVGIGEREETGGGNSSLLPPCVGLWQELHPHNCGAPPPQLGLSLGSCDPGPSLGLLRTRAGNVFPPSQILECFNILYGFP